MPIKFIPAAEPRELISQALQWLREDHQLAMLTLINIEGNAPYPVGTQMLVNERGEFCGQITGGCAEIALSHQAVELIQQGHNTVERYGLNSKYFDIQLPCGSGIDVHFDVQKTTQDYQGIFQSLSNRLMINDCIEGGGFKLNKSYLPNERVLIVGQGPIKTKLAELASLGGFDVVLIDHLEPMALEAYNDRYTALISLFHEHDLEIDLFARSLKFDLFYYGALGSHRTHATRLSQLRDRGLDDSLLDRIHGPIGSDIGAVSPAQIAISILSELVSVMNQGGRFAN